MNSLKLLYFVMLCVGSAGCTLGAGVPVTVVVVSSTPPPTAIPSPTPPPTPTPTETPLPYPWTDEIVTMSGFCFEFALEAAGQLSVLRSAADHIRFYNEADASGLCRRPVTRVPFEFEDGARTLVGLWSAGRGCTARHDVTDHAQDGDTLRVSLRFNTEGDCNYELVQPWWIGVEGVANVEVTVEGPPT